MLKIGICLWSQDCDSKGGSVQLLAACATVHVTKEDDAAGGGRGGQAGGVRIRQDDLVARMLQDDLWEVDFVEFRREV
jgi:hypothetical protein